MSLQIRLQNIKASDMYLKTNTFQANNNVFNRSSFINYSIDKLFKI